MFTAFADSTTTLSFSYTSDHCLSVVLWSWGYGNLSRFDLITLLGFSRWGRSHRPGVLGAYAFRLPHDGVTDLQVALYRLISTLRGPRSLIGRPTILLASQSNLFLPQSRSEAVVMRATGGMDQSAAPVTRHTVGTSAAPLPVLFRPARRARSMQGRNQPVTAGPIWQRPVPARARTASPPVLVPRWPRHDPR